jgi:hypothetical protein
MGIAVIKDGRVTADPDTIAELRALCAEDAAELAEERRIRPDIAPPVTIEVNYLDARQACGTTSNVFNASLLRRTLAACVRYDVPEPEAALAEIVEQLRLISPQDAFEASFACLYVAAQMAALDNFKLARHAGFVTPLGQTMLAFADKLTVRCAELAGAFQRRRDAKRGGKR